MWVNVEQGSLEFHRILIDQSLFCPPAVPELRYCNLHRGLQRSQGDGVALEPPDYRSLQQAATEM